MIETFVYVVNGSCTKNCNSSLYISVNLIHYCIIRHLFPKLGLQSWISVKIKKSKQERWWRRQYWRDCTFYFFFRIEGWTDGFSHPAKMLRRECWSKEGFDLLAARRVGGYYIGVVTGGDAMWGAKIYTWVPFAWSSVNKKVYTWLGRICWLMFWLHWQICWLFDLLIFVLKAFQSWWEHWSKCSWFCFCYRRVISCYLGFREKYM